MDETSEKRMDLAQSQPVPRPYHSLSIIPDINQRIIDGIASGKTLKALAADFNCDHTAILRRAQKHPDYAISLQSSLQAKMEQREEELEVADSNVTVTRADRLLGHARWLAERSCPERWGQKQSGGQITVQIAINKPDGAVCIAATSHNTDS